MSAISFFSLISKHSIQIPIIQRDYAQGRLTATSIRVKFLDDILAYLATDRHLDLDFVYGNLKKGVFIPLDGQQRLTTLFLLHYYLAMKEGNLSDAITYLDRFSYATRTSSRDFCSALIRNEIELDHLLNDSLSITITNTPWFYRSWRRDPTIRSMLVMLDAIHNRFSNTTGMYKKLLNESAPLITFQFLELKDYGLTDALYIKMNARGKHLSLFENFKARLEQRLDKQYPALKAELALKIDNAWTDLFWLHRAGQKFDSRFMNFFRAIAINNYAFESKQSIESNRSIRKLIEGDNKIFIDNDEVFDQSFTEHAIVTAIRTLDALSEDNGAEIDQLLREHFDLAQKPTLFQKLIDNSRLEYADRLLFHAATQYLCNYEYVPDYYQTWMRVIRNLIYNTAYNDAGMFAASLRMISNLVPFANSILVHFSDRTHVVFTFASIQITEERIKAILILKNAQWSEIIYRMEQHGYFKGQIGFLLKYSGIWDYYENKKTLDWSEEENDAFFRSLEQYCRKVIAAFSDRGIKAFPEHIFERALLAKGDYLLDQNRNHCFLINSEDRDISWKRLLRGDNNDQQRHYLKLLLDDLEPDTIQQDLAGIVAASEISDWRKYVIKVPGIIEACGSQKFIRWLGEKDILLLATSATSGYHREYYSYALYLILKQKGNEVYYEPQRSRDDTKYISGINGKSIYISFRYMVTDKERNQRDWVYRVRYNQVETLYKEQEEVIHYLTGQGLIKS